MCGIVEDFTKLMKAFFAVRDALKKEKAVLVSIQFKFEGEDFVRTIRVPEHSCS